MTNEIEYGDINDPGNLPDIRLLATQSEHDVIRNAPPSHLLGAPCTKCKTISTFIVGRVRTAALQSIDGGGRFVGMRCTKCNGFILAVEAARTLEGQE